MTKQKINAAVKLFEDFTGHKAKHIDTVKLPKDSVAIVIGHCEAVAYRTTREGKKERYVHEFEKGAQPLLAVSSDGKQLYILGGDYRFTDRGIEDFK